MEEKTVSLHVKFGQREVVALLALLFVCLHPTSLETETLTLTTYYPAPYGVYEELRATGDTRLAYISGNVGIGTTDPQAKLHVRGLGNTNATSALTVRNSDGNVALSVMNDLNVSIPTNIGIGGAAPNSSYPLHTQGDSYLDGNVGINGNLPNANYGLSVTGPSLAGQYAVNIEGRGRVTESIHFSQSCNPGPVNWTGVGVGGESSCPGGQYATWFKGVYVEGKSDLAHPMEIQVKSNQATIIDFQLGDPKYYCCPGAAL